MAKNRSKCVKCGKKINWEWEDFDWNDGIEHHECKPENGCYCWKCMDCAEGE